MSRPDIDLTKPLSDDDREYLEQSNQTSKLDAAAMYAMGGGADEGKVEEAESQTPPAPPAEPAPTPAPEAPAETPAPEEKPAEQPQG